jgi:hypothetical protein
MRPPIDLIFHIISLRFPERAFTSMHQLHEESPDFVTDEELKLFLKQRPDTLDPIIERQRGVRRRILGTYCAVRHGMILQHLSFIEITSANCLPVDYCGLSVGSNPHCSDFLYVSSSDSRISFVSFECHDRHGLMLLQSQHNYYGQVLKIASSLNPIYFIFRRGEMARGDEVSDPPARHEGHRRDLGESHSEDYGHSKRCVRIGLGLEELHRWCTVTPPCVLSPLRCSCVVLRGVGCRVM